MTKIIKNKEEGIHQVCRGGSDEPIEGCLICSAKGLFGRTSGYAVFNHGNLIVVVKTLAEAKKMLKAFI